MSAENEIQDGKWPILGTKDIVESYKFYVDKLNFIPYQQYNNIAELEQVIVKLEGLFLVLRRSEINGPAIHTKQKVEGKQGQEKELALYIPTRNVFDYYNIIKNKGVNTITEIINGPSDSDLNLFDPDEDGFYVRDSDGNLLVFWTYYSASYDPKFWAWVWEPRLTSERIMQFEKSSEASTKNKVIGWGCLIAFFMGLLVILAIITTHYVISAAALLGLLILGFFIKLINRFYCNRSSK